MDPVVDARGNPTVMNSPIDKPAVTEDIIPQPKANPLQGVPFVDQPYMLPRQGNEPKDM
jgi:hypothetical protein